MKKYISVLILIFQVVFLFAQKEPATEEEKQKLNFEITCNDIDEYFSFIEEEFLKYYRNAYIDPDPYNIIDYDNLIWPELDGSETYLGSIQVGFYKTSEGLFLYCVRFMKKFGLVEVGQTIDSIWAAYGKDFKFKYDQKPDQITLYNNAYDNYIRFYFSKETKIISCIEIGKCGW